MSEPSHKMLVRQVRAAMVHTLGRDYAIKLELLDAPSLQAIAAMMRDVESARRAEKHRAMMRGWVP